MAILDLEDLPFRCPVTPESDRFRPLLYGTKPHIYRVIYAVEEKKKRVEILHVRHGARRALKRGRTRWPRLWVAAVLRPQEAVGFILRG